jgi:hypothetical protein
VPKTVRGIGEGGSTGWLESRSTNRQTDLPGQQWEAARGDGVHWRRSN